MLLKYAGALRSEALRLDGVDDKYVVKYEITGGLKDFYLPQYARSWRLETIATIGDQHRSDVL